MLKILKDSKEILFYRTNWICKAAWAALVNRSYLHLPFYYFFFLYPVCCRKETNVPSSGPSSSRMTLGIYIYFKKRGGRILNHRPGSVRVGRAPLQLWLYLCLRFLLLTNRWITFLNKWIDSQGAEIMEHFGSSWGIDPCLPLRDREPALRERQSHRSCL